MCDELTIVWLACLALAAQLAGEAHGEVGLLALECVIETIKMALRVLGKVATREERVDEWRWIEVRARLGENGGTTAA